MIELFGAESIRFGIALSLIRAQAVRIKEIRPRDEKPGVRDYEVSFLRLIEKITMNSTIKINKRGTEVVFIPGSIIGGTLEFKCSLKRGLSYFIEPLLLLLPFAKTNNRITLEGVTNSAEDMSIDTMKSVSIPMLQWWGLEKDMMELNIIERGFAPNGTGKVLLRIPVVYELNSVEYTDIRPIWRIRGIVVASRNNSYVTKQWIEGARSVFSNYLSDVLIDVERPKGGNGLNSTAGYGGALRGETREGNMFCSDAWASHLEGHFPADVRSDDVSVGADPYALGKQCASGLLANIANSGSVDAMHQPLCLCLMCATPENISRIRLGPLTPRAVRMMRLIHDVLGIKFRVTEQLPLSSSLLPTYIVECRGAGVCNMAKRTK